MNSFFNFIGLLFLLFYFNIILKIIPFDKIPYNIKKIILIVNTITI